MWMMEVWRWIVKKMSPSKQTQGLWRWKNDSDETEFAGS